MTEPNQEMPCNHESEIAALRRLLEAAIATIKYIDIRVKDLEAEKGKK